MTCILIMTCPTLCDCMAYNLYQAPLSTGFSRQEYWSGLPFPSPGDLPDPGTEPRSLWATMEAPFFIFKLTYLF